MSAIPIYYSRVPQRLQAFAQFMVGNNALCLLHVYIIPEDCESVERVGVSYSIQIQCFGLLLLLLLLLFYFISISKLFFLSFSFFVLFSFFLSSFFLSFFFSVLRGGLVVISFCLVSCC